MSDNPFVGNWTYRSLLNDADVSTAFNDLEFGYGSAMGTVLLVILVGLSLANRRANEWLTR